MRIHIWTEQVREIGRRLRADAEHLEQMVERLRRAAGRLAMEGHLRGDLEYRMGAAYRQGMYLVEELHRLGRRLTAIADRFEDADNRSAEGLDLIPWDILRRWDELFRMLFPDGLEGILPWEDRWGAYEWGADFGKLVKDLVEGGKTVAEINAILRGLQVYPGLTYEGQLIIKGGFDIKELAGLSAHLTHLRYGADDIFAQSLTIGGKAFKDTFKPAMIGVEVFLNGVENWGEYKGDVSKVAVATVVDTGLGLALSAGGAWAGAVGLGVIGGALLGPVGAAVGAKAGAFIGGYLGGRLADWLKDEKFHDLREDIVEGGSKFLHGAWDVAADATKTVAQEVDKVLDKAVEKFLSFF